MRKLVARWSLRLVILLIASCTLVHAEHLALKNYSSGDGLGSDVVLHIVEDSRGFLWFSTRDGLSRFDGLRFVTYSTEHGLPVPTVNYFLETRSGEYWVATNGGGACRFNPLASKQGGPLFTVYTMGDSRLSNRVNVLHEDSDGQLWAGTDAGLFRFEGPAAAGAFRRIELGVPALPAPPIRCILDDAGDVWITTWGRLVRRFADGRTSSWLLAQPHTRRAASGLLKRDGVLWFGTEEGLYRLRPAAVDRLSSAGHGGTILEAGELRLFTTDDGLPVNDVTGLQWRSDRLWIATDGGLVEFDGQRFRTFTTKNGLVGIRLRTLTQDSGGNLWFTVSTRSATKLSLNGFVSYTTEDGLADDEVRSIYEHPDGSIVVVGGSFNVNHFDGTRFAAERPDLPGDATTSWMSQTGYLDGSGQLWLLTTHGLYRFDGDRVLESPPTAFYDSRDGLVGNSPFRLYEDRHGDVWIGTRGRTGAGLSRWVRATQTLVSYSEADGLPAEFAPSAFNEDRTGTLWIGGYLGGLARLRNGRFEWFDPGGALPRGGIHAIHVDVNARLWIASTEGGLARLDNPTAERPDFVRYTTAEGLSSNNVRSITDDQWGRIYLGTARGVDRLTPETGRVTHYSMDDGLVSEFVTTSFRDRGGALWFGTPDGLSRLVPRMEELARPPSVRIGTLRVRGRQHPISELGERELAGLELAEDQNHLQLEFFGIGHGLRYRYRLEGADDAWSPLTDQRVVRFASLSPGRYRFSVEASDPDGVDSSMPAMVSFVILPPLWQRWWFLASMAALIAMAAYAVHRARIGRLLALERIRMRIATDLHDDIGSSLSRMAILSEVVERRLGPDQPDLARRLSRVASLAREVVDSMNDIVWAINPRRDRLGDLSQRMRRFASDVFTSRGITFTFQAPDDVLDTPVTANIRREIFLVFKESVHNIVRHAHGSRVQIDFAVARAQLRLTLQDDGEGFDPNDESVGHGLASMRRRAADLGGTLEIVSRNPRGTSVTLCVPLARRRLLRRTAPR